MSTWMSYRLHLLQTLMTSLLVQVWFGTFLVQRNALVTFWMSSLPGVLWIYRWLLNRLSSETIPWLSMKLHQESRFILLPLTSPRDNGQTLMWMHLRMISHNLVCWRVRLLTVRTISPATMKPCGNAVINMRHWSHCSPLPGCSARVQFHLSTSKGETRWLEKEYRASCSTTAYRLWRM